MTKPLAGRLGSTVLSGPLGSAPAWLLHCSFSVPRALWLSWTPQGLEYCSGYLCGPKGWVLQGTGERGLGPARAGLRSSSLSSLSALRLCQEAGVWGLSFLLSRFMSFRPTSLGSTAPPVCSSTSVFLLLLLGDGGAVPGGDPGFMPARANTLPPSAAPLPSLSISPTTTLLTSD